MKMQCSELRGKWNIHLRVSLSLAQVLPAKLPSHLHMYDTGTFYADQHMFLANNKIQ
jgi:hypothetical protein